MPGIYVGGPKTDYSAMQGPAPDGFHIPLTTEWQAVYNIWTALGGGSNDGTNFGIALKLPFAGDRNYENSTVVFQTTYGYYWSSSPHNNSNYAYNLVFDSSSIHPQNSAYRANGFSVRCFKNSPTVPTSSWTKLYGTSIESGGIFWSSADGLISLSSDGSTWITIQDKNLGATQVWNSGDTVSEANCGKYYQRGNNYGFAWTGSLTTSSTQVNASVYGPGNYYSSSTFITRSSSPYRWDSTDNGNLRGGVTGIVEKTGEIKNIYVGTTPVKSVFVGTTKVRPTGWAPGANTLAYYTFDTQTLLNSKTNTVDATRYSGSGSYSTGYKGQGYSANISSGGPIALSSKLPSGDFTICSCLKFNSYPPSSSQLWGWFGNFGRDRNAVHAQFYSGQNFQIRIYAWSSDGTANNFSPGRLSANTRYRFVMTRTGTTIKLYINGNLNGSGTNTESNTQDATYYIGICYDTSRKFNGQIDNVIIENRAWSDAEVRAYDNSIK